MKRVLFVLSTLLMGVFFFGGSCDRLNYEYRHNEPPRVYFVNIPTPDSKFSADTTIYWYGTDVDGFVDFYRYAVVEGNLVNNYGTPDSFLIMTADGAIPWDTVDVNKNDPGTSDEIKMSADVSDPVRKYMTSYIFLQAVDNLGLKSNVIYRTFQKNNHYPNTYITAQDVMDPYVNAFSALSGTSIGWRGVDSADYLDPPPFVFKWKLFGPYTDAEMAEINNNYVDSVFLDKYGDIYFRDDSYPIDDTNRVPVLQVDRVHGSWQEIIFLDTMTDTIPPRLRTFLPIPNSMLRTVDSSGMDSASTFTYRDWTPEWTTETEQVLYNVFYNSTFNHDTTSQYNFLLWCRSRDDSRVMDAIPDFQWISVIDPKFERDIIMLDMTVWKAAGAAGSWNPSKREKSKMVFGRMANDWGRRSLGKDSIMDLGVMDNKSFANPDGSFCTIPLSYYKSSQDYYPVAEILAYAYPNCPQAYEIVPLREILKHKVIIVIKDHVQDQLNLTGGGASPSGLPELVSVIDGLNAGMSCWSMGRDAFGSIPDPFIPGFSTQLSDAYRNYFGVLRIFIEGWSAANRNDDIGIYQMARRNENFIGADVVSEFAGAYPPLVIDTNLLESRYTWGDPRPPGLLNYPFRFPGWCMPDVGGQIIVGALPEVGFVEKSPSSAVRAIYLYKSLYRPVGDTSAESSDLTEVGTYKEYEIPTGDCFSLTPYLNVGTYIAYKGRVVALYTDAYYFRTSHFSFSLLPMDSIAAKQVFNSMMDSLYASPLIAQTGKMAAPNSMSMKRHSGVNVDELRRITKDLHDMKAEEIRKWRDPNSEQNSEW
jgi:hypothetical protein